MRSFLRDHPRSRGVYILPAALMAVIVGSSPLARGLRRRDAAHRPRFWIIPARAGFTAPSCAPRPAPKDHPRSRGVYPEIARDALLEAGSSPLARGLRRPHRHVRERLGIIPARAGFTRRPRGWRRRAGDHPRSRGVYPAQIRAWLGALGSSPLARGLPLTSCV